MLSGERVDGPVDIIHAAKQLWKWRLPMTVVLAGVVAGGVAYSLTRPRMYRATAIIAAPRPQVYLEVDGESRRIMDFPGINKRGLIRHARQLSDSDWARETLSARSSSAEAAALARTVRGRVTSTYGKSDLALQVSVDAGAPALAARGANALADAYTAEAGCWEEPEIRTALTAIRQRNRQLAGAVAQIERDLRAAATEGMAERDIRAEVRLLSRVTSADALSQQVQLEATAAREEVSAALDAAGVDATESIPLAVELVEMPLPGGLEEEITGFERARARSLIDGSDDKVENPTAAAPPEILSQGPLPRDEMSGMVTTALGDKVAAKLDLPAMVDLWVKTRRSAIRANVFGGIRDRLRDRVADQALGGKHAEELARETRSLRESRRRLEQAECLLVECLREGRAGELTVLTPAVPPTRPTRPGLVRRLAAVFMIGLIVALGVGLVLETFVPRRATSDRSPG